MTLSCQHCKQRIPFRTILFAACPVWISCPHCRARLIGSRLVKIQSFVVVPIIALSGGVTVALTQWTWLVKLTLILVGGMALGVPNVAATMKWGHYATRKHPVAAGQPDAAPK